MLAESIIRIGRPIRNSNLSPRERIRLLTDVGSENCKNYFRNVFIIELNGEASSFHKLELGNVTTVNKKETFKVDDRRNTAFPIFYPNGGNPLHAQGIYPLPCYLMYDPHIKAMKDKGDCIQFLLPRISSTLNYRDLSDEYKEALAERVADLMVQEGAKYVEDAKQLGILMIYDENLPMFRKLGQRIEDEALLLVAPSSLVPGSYLYLDGERILERISKAKFYEASALGKETGAVSTFSNLRVDEVVSIYNKAWLWLSPTWEMPRSIYWQEDNWTKGIKVDAESYDSFYYGVQFLRELQVPVSNAILKEMFSPISSVEAKKNMSMSSFEAIYGIPMVLPLVDGDSQQIFDKYRNMLKKDAKQNDNDLHLKVLAGIDKVVPECSDEHRLTILYYSGDLSRGNMHIRAVIEDVLPSVAKRVEKTLRLLRDREIKEIQAAFGMKEHPVYRTESLPSLLANAYGSGYVWETLQATLHKEPLRIERLRFATAKKLNELANKEDIWQMIQELVFYYSFLFFVKRYREDILQTKGGVTTLADWKGFIALYNQGKLKLEDFESVEQLGFVSGLLLRQFSNSYFQKTKKEYVKQRVMKFGSKLTPEMIWKNGLLRCEELAQQWDMGLGANFRPILAQSLLGFLEKQNQLVPEKDTFMTAFWSGYLLFQADKKNEKVEGGVINGD